MSQPDIKRLPYLSRLAIPGNTDADVVWCPMAEDEQDADVVSCQVLVSVKLADDGKHGA